MSIRLSRSLRLPDRWRRRAAYAGPALLAFLAAQTWFQLGTVVAIGDLTPPIAPGQDYRSHWNYLARAVGGASYDIVALPYYETLSAFTRAGLGEELFQRLWLSGLFAASTAAFVFFTMRLTDKPLAAAVAGLFTAFNAYHLVIHADYVPLVAIVEAGFLGGVIVSAGLREDAGGLVPTFALLSLGLSLTFVNPPHVILVALWALFSCVAAVAVAGRRAFLRILRFLAKAIPLAILVNLWWIVPAFLTLYGPGAGGWSPAIDVDDWAWTHARASLVNAATLNTSWAWSYSEYFPYAARLDSFPFEVLRFCLPVLAVLGICVARAREKRLGLLCGASAFALFWVAKGLHPPAPEVNRWLYANVPGFWLFRDPSKVLLLVSLIYAILAGVAVDRLLEVRGFFRKFAISTALVLTAGAVIYVHPLFTGEVIPDDRPTPHASHVRVPAAWRDLGQLIRQDPRPGRVLILPAIDFYQIPTTWRYYGASFSRPLLRRGVLEYSAETGSYLRSPPAIPRIVSAVENDLLEGRDRQVGRKLQALAVRYVVLRRDLSPDVPGRHFAPFEDLTLGLRRVPELKLIRTFGRPKMLDLYAVRNDVSDFFAATPVSFRGTSDLIPRALEEMPEKAALIAAGKEERTTATNRTVRILRSRDAHISRVFARFGEGRVMVRLVDSLRRRVGGNPAKSSSQEVTFTSRSQNGLLTIGQTGLRISQGSKSWTSLGFIYYRDPALITFWQPEWSGRLPLRAKPPLGDCNRHDRRSPEEVGLSASTIQQEGRRFLRLTARDHAACVSLPVKPLDRTTRYRLSFSYRRVQGSPPRACLWQDGPERCAPLPSLDSSQGWHRVDTTVAPEPGTKRLSLLFYADGAGTKTTVSDYGDPVAQAYKKAASLPLIGTEEAPELVRFPETTLESTSPNWLRASFAPDLSHLLGDCYRYDNRSPAQVGLSASTIKRDGRPVLRLTARDHAACVAFPVEPFDPAARYRVAFAYRRVQGSPPRACLWQEGPERCAPLPTLESPPGWHHVDTTVAPERGTERLSLFFYADGAGDSTTVSEYRDFTVAPFEPTAFLGVPLLRRLPSVSQKRLGPAEFRVRVVGSTEPFLLVFSEGYAPGWRVESGDRRHSRDAPHVQVNGYANGWVIPWKGTYELRVSYEPERFAESAKWMSAIGLIVGLAWILVPWGRLRVIAPIAGSIKRKSAHSQRQPK